MDSCFLSGGEALVTVNIYGFHLFYVFFFFFCFFFFIFSCLPGLFLHLLKIPSTDTMVWWLFWI
jgi:hypothetical protein